MSDVADPKSRSEARRVAVQKGEPTPTFIESSDRLEAARRYCEHHDLLVRWDTATNCAAGAFDGKCRMVEALVIVRDENGNWPLSLLDAIRERLGVDPWTVQEVVESAVAADSTTNNYQSTTNLVVGASGSEQETG